MQSLVLMRSISDIRMLVLAAVEEQLRVKIHARVSVTSWPACFETPARRGDLTNAFAASCAASWPAC
jgi:hypothetical protein